MIPDQSQGNAMYPQAQNPGFNEMIPGQNPGAMEFVPQPQDQVVNEMIPGQNPGAMEFMPRSNDGNLVR